MPRSVNVRSPASRIPLTRARIATAAVALLDRDGPSGLSARRLAAELGCEAMSLYHHVAGMEEVLDLAVDRLLAEIPLPAPKPKPKQWRRQLRELCEAYRGVARRHPLAFVLVATRLLTGPAAAALGARFLDIVAAGGAGEEQALRVARVVTAYLNGVLLAETAWRRASDRPRRTAPAWVPVPTRANAAAVSEDLDFGLAKLLLALESDLCGRGPRRRPGPTRNTSCSPRTPRVEP